MRRPTSVLILFVLLAFGASLAVPAEDLPGTAYDESEEVPYECVPHFSGALPQASARTASSEFSIDSVSCLHFLTKERRLPRENNSLSHFVPDSLTIINQSLRC